MIGRTISHYKILEEIGSGGMGIVYKAEDTQLKRTVALKFLPPEFTRDKEAKKRFIHEAQAAAALEHPNICNIHEIEETPEGQMFIVMAIYEGETLKEMVTDTPLPVDKAIDITLQIAEGLDKAHQKDIVHRDIKSANIIITKDGIPKILDFGLAKLRGQTKLTKESTTLGTVAYMSPEQTIGEKVDERTDIWSLGVVFYEMITGELPFKGHYEQAIMYSIMNEEPEYVSKLNKDVPSQLEKIVHKALKKNPEKRFQSMSEMREALQQILETSLSSEGIKPSPVFRLGRKQRRILVRLLPLGIAVIVAGAFLWLSRDTMSKPKSIAILPFLTIGGQTGQDWFSEGMTDTLITNLAKIRELRVTSRTSVMKFKESKKTAREIAKELNVSYIIEGSVQKNDNRIKITTRLIDPSRDEYLWAQDYERDLSNILSLQSDVARAIANKIKVSLTPQEKTILTEQRTVNPSAYEAYLKGNFYFYRLTRESLNTAMKYFKMAVELDPEYAPAYVGIAMVWGVRAQMGFVPFHLAHEKMEPAAEKAQELDSTLVEVYFLKALMYSWWGWKWDLALKEYEKVIELNPNMAEARANYSQILFMFNRPEEGMRQIKQAMALDPFNSMFKAFYAMDLMYVRCYDEVIDSMEKLLKASPEEYMALTTLRSAYHQKKMYDDALRIWRLSFKARNDHEAIETLDKGNDEGGYSIALKRVAELMIERAERGIHVTPWQIATLYTRAGMPDEALLWFEKALEARDPNMPYLKVDPIFDDLREDPRFIMLLKKIGFRQ
jgi:serine/threonine protein kinase